MWIKCALFREHELDRDLDVTEAELREPEHVELLQVAEHAADDALVVVLHVLQRRVPSALSTCETET
jgi:hypothetical protein